MIKLYNTLSRKLEEFKPIDPDQKTVRLYTCGPTVYDFSHIGNLRSYIFADVLRRTLEHNNYAVEWLMNITDVDDKTIRKTIERYGDQATPEDLKKLTSEYTALFFEDLKKVNIPQDKIKFVTVSESIPDIQKFIIKLIEVGYAYTAPDGSTYFSIEKYQHDFSDYGELVGSDFLKGKKVGARVKVDEYEKDNLSDFALWKAHDAADGQIFWDHPTLGKGRPGWHIECSAINHLGFAGKTTDIHTGGVDLIFPHHTNEIAQSQPVYKPFVNYWSHCEHLQIDSKKMAKREKNFYTLKDLEEHVHSDSAGYAFRYLMLQAHHHTQLNFTWESLEAASKALTRLYKFVGSDTASSSGIESYEQKFLEAINNDLNTPQALALTWEMLESDAPKSDKLASLLKFDQILGLKLKSASLIIEAHKDVKVTEEIQTLIDQREEARKQKNFTKSDELRQQIEGQGYEVSDTDTGPLIKRKTS
jgi:cysteinyl-tRNA synthetase